MAGVEVRVDPTATTCTKGRVKFTATYKSHVMPKYRVAKGLGRDTGRILCAACPTNDEVPAITRENARIEQAELDRIAAEEDRLHRSAGQRYWPWGWAAGAAVALLLGWWLIAAVASVVALVGFAFLAPVPCCSTVDADPEPCEEWGRGFLRACPDHKHAQRQHDLLLDAFRERRRPVLIWDERMAKGALYGAGMSAVLLVVSGVAYGLTVIF